jgi:hypothetical protein
MSSINYLKDKILLTIHLNVYEMLDIAFNCHHQHHHLHYHLNCSTLYETNCN